jgi:thiamine biosynthesis lipoprotein
LRTFEHQYSRFQPDSFISQLNTTGRINQPNRALLDLLTIGKEQYHRTHGVFNIMVGSKLVETGYDVNYSFTPQTHQTPIANPHDVLTLDESAITLSQGTVDIGGYGKGFAIDALATRLRTQHDIHYFLINGGGDMYATSDHGEPLAIYLEHPTATDTYLATTTLYNQGFAASSPHKRTWTHAGTTYTHIIDTTTTTERTRSKPDATFIKASTACTADIFATVALLVTPPIMDIFAAQEKLGVASYSVADNSLTHNHAFS